MWERILFLVWVVSAAGGTMAQGPAGQTLNAALLKGADAGAQINAADAQLGAAAGTIVYRGAAGAVASTPVVLRARHALALDSPVTWRTTVKLPAGSGGQSISCAGLQKLDYAKGGTWIDAGGTADVSLHDCRAAGTLKTGETTALGGGGMRRLRIVNNRMQDVQLISATASEPKYEDVTAANSSGDITVTGNQGMDSAGKGVFILLAYTNGALVEKNTMTNYTFGVQWWGGDSCVGGGCTAGGNGAAANARKLSGLVIRENKVMATQACIWGSMGRGLTITGNTCASAGPGTGDVGIDLEGTEDSTVSGNSVKGFRNGSLGVFFLATRNVWTNNVVQDDGGEAPIGIHNSTQNPAGLSETFTGNTFTCAAACATIVEATGKLTVSRNQFTNVYFVTGSNVSEIELAGNTFLDGVGLPGGVNVTNLVGTGAQAGSAVVRGNTITSDAVQSAGTAAIMVSGNDYNREQQTVIDGNVLGGTHPFPVDIVCAAASGNSAAQGNHCSITDNTLGADAVVTKAGPKTQVFVTKSGNRCRAGGRC